MGLFEGFAMDGKRKYIYATLAMSCFLVACGSPVKSSKSATPNFTVGGGSGGSSNPSVGDTPSDAAGFFIKLLSDNAEITLHRADVQYEDSSNVRQDAGTTNLTEECKITSSDTGDDLDKFCIAEMEELDLYFNALTLQYHVPPSMCSYVSFIPYYFYVFEPGQGPSSVSYALAVGGGTIEYPDGNTKDGIPYCQYDYTTLSSEFPNCCTGKYTLTIQDFPQNKVTTTTGNPWNGKASNCIFGNATTWDFKDELDFPTPRITYVEGVGYNQSFSISAAGKTGSYASNIWAGNFYNPSDHTWVAGKGTTPSGVDPNRPQALRIPENVAGLDKHLPSDTYRVICYDRAQEIKARIRLMIREWNSSPITSGGNPDATGSDPGFPGNVINDRWDWLDFENAGMAYPTSYL